MKERKKILFKYLSLIIKIVCNCVDYTAAVVTLKQVGIIKQEMISETTTRGGFIGVYFRSLNFICSLSACGINMKHYTALNINKYRCQ